MSVVSCEGMPNPAGGASVVFEISTPPNWWSGWDLGLGYRRIIGSSSRNRQTQPSLIAKSQNPDTMEKNVLLLCLCCEELNEVQSAAEAEVQDWQLFGIKRVQAHLDDHQREMRAN